MDNKDYDKKIIAALEQRDPAKLTTVLAELKEKGLDINECLGDYNYLEYAYDVNAPLDCYELLLQAGASSTEQIRAGAAPLFRAVIATREDAALTFIRYGGEINMWGNCGGTEIYLEGFYDVNLETREVTPIFEAPDPDPDYENKAEPISKPLICVAIENYYRNDAKRILAALLERPDLNLLASDELNDNAYSYAVAYGDVRLLKKLEELEPKIINYEKNNNLLNIAVENGQYENMKYLLENGKVEINASSRVWPEDCLEKLLQIHNHEISNYVQGYREEAKAVEVIKSDERLATLAKMFTLLKSYNIKFSEASERYYTAALKMKHGVLPRPDKTRERI